MIEGFILRPHTLDDIAFIDSSWGSSYYAGIKAFRLMDPDKFHTYHRDIRHRILSSKDIQITVCAPEEDHWHILGYVISQKIKGEKDECDLIHYIYVKQPFRKEGIAQHLLKKSITTENAIYTHLTIRGIEVISKNYQHFKKYYFIPHIV